MRVLFLFFLRFFFSKKGTLPPSALVGTKQMLKDPRCEPLYRERVRYVVVQGEPNSRLTDQVISPEEFMANPALRIHATYYITKQIIPALSRYLNLVGADLHSWFAEIPRTNRVQRPLANIPARRVVGDKSTIDHYYHSTHCYLCDRVSPQEICPRCLGREQESALVLFTKLRRLEKKRHQLHTVCSSCCGTSNAPISCTSLDCLLYFKRVKNARELSSHERFVNILEQRPSSAATS